MGGRGEAPAGGRMSAGWLRTGAQWVVALSDSQLGKGDACISCTTNVRALSTVNDELTFIGYNEEQV